jgi:hypothetical protein
VDDRRFTVGFTLPALSQQLTREGNRPWGLEGTEVVRFYMREAQSDVLVVNDAPAVISDVTSDTVRYDWQVADVAVEGDFRGWFRITPVAGDPEETEEFDILGVAHSPGLGVRTGPVARAARREIPIAWDYLSSLPGYGDVELSEKIETVKLTVLGYTMSIADEESADKRVVDYLGKMAAIDVIPAAIDYWTDRMVSQSARGSDEVITYPNRIAALESKLKYLLAVTERMRPRIEDIIGRVTKRSEPGPAVDTEGPLVTPGLENFPAPFGGQSTDPRRRNPVNY